MVSLSCLSVIIIGHHIFINSVTFIRIYVKTLVRRFRIRYMYIRLFSFERVIIHPTLPYLYKLVKVPIGSNCGSV